MVFIPPLKPLGAIKTIDDSDPRYIAYINDEAEMRDGGRIRLNVFLPRLASEVKDTKYPVIMMATCYGKDVPYLECPAYKHSAPDVPEDQRCKHLSWEAPSPAWWCPRGYAVVYADQRGSDQSPGLLVPFGNQHYEDYAECITWAADQSWSNGKVGLSGISYLALNQWPTAALQPRGLAGAIPWEGMADYYRDAVYRGGIFSKVATKTWWESQVAPQQFGSDKRSELLFGPDSPEGVLLPDQLAENTISPYVLKESPFIDDQAFQERGLEIDLSKIECPLLSAGNWGGVRLHLRGNILAWWRASSKYKFLRLHTGRHDLPFYLPEHLEIQKSFYDCFLNGDDHGGWKTGKQSKVTMKIRKGSPTPNTVEGERQFQWRSENEWPLARTQYKMLHVTRDGGLQPLQDHHTGIVSYHGYNGGSVRFETDPAVEPYEICGHITARLAMSVSDFEGSSLNPEMDVFVGLRKFGRDGSEIFYTGTAGWSTMVTLGWIRASHRKLTDKPYSDLKETLPFPSLSHRRADHQPIEANKIYDLVFELWPTQVVVEKGERLVFEVSPKDIEGFDELDSSLNAADTHNGKNNIHIGSEHSNYLILPYV